MAGAQLLAPDGSPSACAWRLPGVGTALAQALFLHRLLVTQSGRGPERAAGRAGCNRRRCSCAARAAEQVGYLDPEFFVYSDETDFQKRLGDAGWEILHVPEALAVHHEQLTFDRAAGERRVVEFHRNRDLYMRKHHGAAAALAVRVLTAWNYAVRAARGRWWCPGREPAGTGSTPARRCARRRPGIREAAEERNRRRDADAGGGDSVSPTSEVLAAFELERLLYRAAATRFERTPCGFVCANADLPMVWDASRVQVEPDGEPPTLEELRRAGRAAVASGIRSCATATAFLAHSEANRELAYSLAREGWHVTELWLMICRLPPDRVPRGRKPLEGPAMRRLKGRLGVEQGLPPASIEQFDRYDDLRARAAARLAFGGFDGATPMALADMYLRGDIAAIEDVATLNRARGRGLATAAVLGATAAARSASPPAPSTCSRRPRSPAGFYEPLGFEQIASAWECELPPPGEHAMAAGIR